MTNTPVFIHVYMDFSITPMNATFRELNLILSSVSSLREAESKSTLNVTVYYNLRP
jgi:hypothetical protein